MSEDHQEIADRNKETIRKFHNRIMKVVLKDEREFVGRFVCVDNKMNTILKETTEYRKKPTSTSEEAISFDERRVGLVMLPGTLITSCFISE
ncbi:hypothetical protein C9374_004103 [Naegleria lovaniensis]|uniref:Sm domain-containing protein n=1 Tax=Naegleria lovaniensis TaxID=51637 RepID=A0AA88KJN7_NAELO|nr:uncharacterized protein C9374_004103 [Naegleria lovaniensis]KAG2383432.1 hypothetical protein C9374_004103 [Naegleria lovaniensis]